MRKLAGIFFAVWGLTTQVVWGAEKNVLNIPDPIVSKVGFDQRLNAQVPLKTEFKDETGKTLQFGDLLGPRPLLLAFVYYSCPHLCPLEVRGILQSLQSVAFQVGSEFEVALVSMDPKDTPDYAAKKRRDFLFGFSHPKKEKGFHFLTGSEASIQSLARAVGFRYTYDTQSEEFAHPAGVIILTPEGRISRYLYGIDFPSRDLRLALVEASQNKIGNPIDKFLLFCYHYDPVGGRYGLVITKALRIAGAATVLMLLSGVGVMLARERRRRSSSGPSKCGGNTEGSPRDTLESP